jgi:2-polyprenyl-6-methoxyphenol hydroxylase-like FAD-dependent oxidoreductase
LTKQGNVDFGSGDVMEQVVVVGAGPTGLMLAAVLCRQGIVPRIIDQRDGILNQSKALAVAARTLEIFDDLGIARQAVALGRPIRSLQIHYGTKLAATIDIDELESQFPYGLCLPQWETESILTEFGREHGLRVDWGVRLDKLIPYDDHVEMVLRHSHGEIERARSRWTVGCDGSHSTVRHQAGIRRHGKNLQHTFVLADCSARWDIDPHALHAWFNDSGAFAVIPMPKENGWRVLCEYREADDPGAHPDLRLLSRLVSERTPLDPELFDSVWTTRFESWQRRAEAFRLGRVMIAGDAAHSHSAIGGQGMNTGLQDAFNLAWKLALVIRGLAGDVVLDAYSAERTSVADHVLRLTETATRAVTFRGVVPAGIRQRMAGFASQFAPVHTAVARGLGELGIHYRNSALVAERWSGPDKTRLGQHVPRAGDLAPDGYLHDGAIITRLRALIGDDRHCLLVFAGYLDDPAWLAALRHEAAKAVGKYATWYVVARGPLATAPDGVLMDPSGVVHARYGADREPVLYLLRPDHHIGYRDDRLDLDAVRRYWNRLTG